MKKTAMAIALSAVIAGSAVANEGHEAGFHRLAQRVLQRGDRAALAHRIGTRFADPR